MSSTPYSFPLTPFYSSQSATSCYQECPRRYLFNYRLYGTGIVPRYSSIPLTTGGCVHKGVEAIVTTYLKDPTFANNSLHLEERGVGIALAEYMKIVSTHPLTQVGSLPEQQNAIYQEQLALTEALVRLWYMYEWPKIVQYYDILAVEQEIVFPAEGILYQSKPDLILLHKQNGDVVNYSLKTTKSFSDRLEKSYKVQMQAATEPYATNTWLKSLKHSIQEAYLAIDLGADIQNSFITPKMNAMARYLYGLNAKIPSESSATRFCYLIKGDFKEDKRGSGIYRTDSSLIYGWRKLTPSGFEYVCINKVPKPENQSGYGLLGKGWERFKVYEDEEVGGVKGWLEMIQKGERVCNDIGEGPILEKYIVSQPDIYTNPTLIKTKIRQISSIESNIFHALNAIDKYPPEAVDGRQWLIDDLFPMNTNSCHWPTTCSYLSICPNGGDSYKDHIASDPLNDEWGMFERRISHHQPEKEFMDSLVQIEGV